MSAAPPAELFDNYQKMPRRLPMAVWYVLRGAAFAVLAGEVALLFVAPEIGTKLFWGAIVPALPAVFAVAPGLWRQVCPLALANQAPRMLGFTRGRALPETLRALAYPAAVIAFLVMVALRMPLLNDNGPALAAVIIGFVVLAFAGGVVFRGRSGWCGTFCPLAPIQRSHGQSPLVLVRNGYCPTCVGCQKNCYDFNPRAAVFGDIYDTDPNYAGQRRFFMSMLPGLIYGFFSQGPAPQYGYALYLAILGGYTLASVGLYYSLISFLKVSPYKVATAFGAIALAAFYWFAGPLIVGTIGELTGYAPPPWAAPLSQALAALVAIAVTVQAIASERRFQALVRESERAKVDQSKGSLRDRLGRGVEVTERSANVSFPVASDQTLLEAMEAAGVKIDFGCRSGLCGADAVAIVDGMDNLLPAAGEEAATLRRLGLEGRARLACCCRVRGPVTIDRDPKSAPPPPSAAAPAAPAVDPALAAGVRRVVIVGNGVAGISVAETLRRESPGVEIAVIAGEAHHFYNRMAIGRVIYGRSAMDGLFLLPESWYRDNRIEVWRSTLAVAVDRERRTVTLGTGDTLEYDRLVLATGAAAAPPDAAFAGRANAFVLRDAADAQAIRGYIQAHRAKTAVVIGGGVLGVEAADALRHLGLRTTIVQRSGRLMDRQLDQEGAEMLTRFLEGIGIAVVTDAVVDAYEGEAALAALRLADGRRLEADLFVACAGIRPNADLARACGLEVGRGIRTDAHMRTSDPDILAVGDVAELPGAVGGLWPVGVAHARAAVASMLGREEAYAAPRMVLQLKCEGIDLRSFGEIECADGSAETIVAAPGAPAWWRLVLRDRRIAGAVYVGPPGSSKELARALQSDLDLAPVLSRLRTGQLAALRELGPPEQSAPS